MAAIRSSPVAIALALAACRAPDAPPPPSPVSACVEDMFEGSSFVRCDPGEGRITLVTGKRRFSDLGLDPNSLLFAMNAGMFDDEGKAIGLAIVDGREEKAINRRTRGFGNFHLQPNGVFVVRDNGRAEVVTTAAYKPASDTAFATQSGPMLLVDGKPNANFDADGQSRYIRNGVGVDPAGKPHFVISLDPVSFGRMARYFRDKIKARDALYFDGSVSSLWDPANGRMDNVTDLGPMIVVLKPGPTRSAGSAPGRASRATP